MTHVFILFAVLAFIGLGIQARRRNGHGMAHAFLVFALWIVAAIWWSRG